MNKKFFLINIIIIIVLLLIGYVIFKPLIGPGKRESDEIKKYVENYLTKKYGEHTYKITNIIYEFSDHDTITFLDYSPIGYQVGYTWDEVNKSNLVIYGLISDSDKKVKSDSLIYYYYLKPQNIEIEDIGPKEELKKILLTELRDEFDTNIFEIDDFTFDFNIPDNYGKIPTLDELKNDISLYEVSDFEFKTTNTIDNTDEYIDEYLESLEKFIQKKFNSDEPNVIYYDYSNTVWVGI